MKTPLLRWIARLMLITTLGLSGCAETQLASHWFKRLSAPEQNPVYKVGKPYQVADVWYYPQESFNRLETGIASWYGPDFHGNYTANGEIYDQNELTAAHRTLQLPSFARVTNLENGRSVVVRVNDRGPYLRGRIVDVSKRAAELLGFIGKGTARVRLEVLGPESKQLAEAAKRGVNTTGMTYSSFVPSPVSPASLASVQELNKSPVAETAALPDSLKTPTITVEEMNDNRIAGLVLAAAPAPSPFPPPGPMPVHVKKGKILPDPVVAHEPVRPTGLFVQAGAFVIEANAQRLADRLKPIGATHVDPLAQNGRVLYRVRVGPFPTVAAADAALAQVMRAAGGGVRVVGK